MTAIQNGQQRSAAKKRGKREASAARKLTEAASLGLSVVELQALKSAEVETLRGESKSWTSPTAAIPVLHSVYSSLPMARNALGGCIRCDNRYRNPARQMLSGGDIVEVIECEECGELMKPYA